MHEFLQAKANGSAWAPQDWKHTTTVKEIGGSDLLVCGWLDHLGVRACSSDLFGGVPKSELAHETSELA